MLLRIGLIITVFLANIALADNIIRDAEMELVIGDIVKPLVEYAKLPAEKVKIRIIQNDQINAFATYGMEIYIYTGLLVKDINPNMMAGILAHEIGHIAGGHLYKSAQSNEELMSEALGLILLGSIAGIASDNKDAFLGSATLAAQLLERKSLRFSRMQEYQADNFALASLNQSHYPIKGFLGFFQESRGREFVTGLSAYTSTHPTGQDRIDNIHRFLNINHISNNFTFEQNIQNCYRKAIIKFKAYLSKDKALIEKLAPNMTEEEKEYAYAVFYHSKGEYLKAINYVQSLIKRFPKNPFYHELYGQILYENGAIEGAIKELNYAWEILPQNPLINMELAQFEIQLASKNKQKKLLDNAISRLKFVTIQEEDNSIIYRLLGRAYGEKAEEPMANFYFSKEALMNQDYKKAILFASRALKGLDKDSSAYFECESVLEDAKKGKYQ